MSCVLVTGAGGFVGSTLCAVLARAGYTVRAAVRVAGPVAVGASSTVIVGDVGPDCSWRAALEGVDCVIHLAARAHVLKAARDDQTEYLRTNAEGTLNLARQAAAAGVRRLIFLSSVKVNGEFSAPGRAFRAADVPQPKDAYGESKWRAEQLLLDAGAATPMQVVIVRPPLVYGPGVKANFLRLMRWVDRELPLPLDSVKNRRSLVSVWNLCDLLCTAVSSSSAGGRIFMVSDAESLSTPELIRRIAAAMQRRARLWPFPVRALEAFAGALGRRAEAMRLCGSLEVDMESTRTELGWSPPMSVDDALRRTVDWYLSRQHPRGP